MEVVMMPSGKLMLPQKLKEKEKIIEKKIKSYITQDNNKFGFTHWSTSLTGRTTSLSTCRPLPAEYVDVDYVKTLLDIQSNKCYICKEDVKILYKPNCKNQFTLDRINNKNPHFKGNVLVACHYCNCREFGLNPKTCSKESCCPDKPDNVRSKSEVTEEEWFNIISKCNDVYKDNYWPSDEWGVMGYLPRISFEEQKKHDEDVLRAALQKDGYCECGRKEEEDSYGCWNYPACLEPSFSRPSLLQMLSR